ncbi:MAG: hypothetical protein AB7F66_13505 [Bacteriovoracia bacterium]
MEVFVFPRPKTRNPLNHKLFRALEEAHLDAIETRLNSIPPGELCDLKALSEELDGLFRAQHERRSEDQTVIEFMRNPGPYTLGVLALVTAGIFTPDSAHAADIEQSLRNLVTVFTGRILPILALGYLGKNIFAHIQGDPNAKNETFRVVIALTCLLGLAGVWNLISQQVR